MATEKKWLTASNLYNLRNSNQPIWKSILDSSQNGFGSTRVTIPALEGDTFREYRLVSYNPATKKWRKTKEASIHTWTIPTVRGNIDQYFGISLYGEHNDAANKNFRNVAESSDNDWRPHDKTFYKQDFIDPIAQILNKHASVCLASSPWFDVNKGVNSKDLSKIISVKPQVIVNRLTANAKALLKNKDTYKDVVDGYANWDQRKIRKILQDIIKEPLAFITDYMSMYKKAQGAAYSPKTIKRENTAKIPQLLFKSGKTQAEASSVQNQLDSNEVYDLSDFQYNYAWFFYAESSDGKSFGWQLYTPDTFEYMMGSDRYYATNFGKKISLDTIDLLGFEQSVNVNLVISNIEKKSITEDTINPPGFMQNDAYDYKTASGNFNGLDILSDLVNDTRVSAQLAASIQEKGRNIQKGGILAATAQGGIVAVQNKESQTKQELRLQATPIVGTNQWNIILIDSKGQPVPTVNQRANPVLFTRTKAIASLHGLSQNIIGQPFEDTSIGSMEPKLNKSYAHPLVSRQFDRKNQFIEVILDRVIDLNQDFFVNLINQSRNESSLLSSRSKQASDMLNIQYKDTTPDKLNGVYSQEKAKYSAMLSPLMSKTRNASEEQKVKYLNEILKLINVELFGLALSITSVKEIQKSINTSTVSLAQINSLKTILDNAKKRYADYKAKLTKLESDMNKPGVSIDLKTFGDKGKSMFNLPKQMPVIPIGITTNQQATIPPDAVQFIEQNIPLINQFITPSQKVRTNQIDGVILAQFATGLDAIVKEGLLSLDDAKSVMDYYIEVDPNQNTSSIKDIKVPKDVKTSPSQTPNKNQATNSVNASAAVSKAQNTNLFNVKLFGYNYLGNVVDVPPAAASYIRIKPALLNKIKPNLKDSYVIDDALFQSMLKEAMEAKAIQLRLANEEPVIKEDLIIDQVEPDNTIPEPVTTQDEPPIITPVVVMENKVMDDEKSNMGLYLGIGAVIAAGGAYLYFKNKKK